MEVARERKYAMQTQCAVCATETETGQAAAERLMTNYGGSIFYFCSWVCKQQFDQTPQAYVPPAGRWSSSESAPQNLGDEPGNPPAAT